MATKKPDPVRPAQRFWIATQAIIVGLAVKTALEQMHGNVSPGLSGGQPFSLERTLVYSAFAILLIRFYAGAFRFGELRDDTTSTFASIKNLLGSAASFSLFYLMADSVNDTALFIKYTILLHLVDVLWFGATWWRNWEVGNEAKVKIARPFFGMSILSVGVLLTCPSDVGRLLFLILISLVDFVILSPYYFEGKAEFLLERWPTGKAAVSARA